MDYKNYIQLDGKTGLFRNNVDFIYVDIHETDEYAPYEDRLFMLNNYYWVKFKGDFKHDDHEFVIVWCRIPSKHVAEFKSVMNLLKTGIILLGHPNYPKFCKDVFTKRFKNRDIIEKLGINLLRR